MKRISIRNSFTFQQRVVIEVYDPMKTFLRQKGYELQFKPGELQMDEREFAQVGFFPDVLAGISKCLHLADTWVFEYLCGLTEEVLMVLWSMTFRDYLDFLAGKFDPFQEKQTVLVMAELGRLPEKKENPFEDRLLQAVERRAGMFPELPYRMRVWLEQSGIDPVKNRARLEAISIPFRDKHKEVLQLMSDSRAAGYEGDDHWAALEVKMEKVYHYWQESLEFLA